MDDILKKLAQVLRPLGFKGSGSNFRKVQGDFVFIVNFQGSRRGDVFFVNIAAQPDFLPCEGNAVFDAGKLKEAQCVFRRRVGLEWSWCMTDAQFYAFESVLVSSMQEFFDRIHELKDAVTTDSPESLVARFCPDMMTTKARSALHLARASIAFGNRAKALTIAKHGVELSGERAVTLRSELNSILSSA